jgi:hypothetical protein
LVGTSTGSLSLNDFGGTGGGTWTVPTFDNEHKEYQLAEAFYEDVGELLQTADDVNELSFGIQIPYNFAPNGNQFIQIEVLKSDYSAATSAEVPPYSMRLDHIGLSYTNGRWVYSARDMTKLANPTGTPNPPPTGGGGGTNPPSGGGSNTCVREDVPVWIWSDDGNHFWLKASEVVIGDRLVAWDGERLAPATVYKVIHGISRSNYLVYAAGYELPCSFSHRLISDFDDFEIGTRINMSAESVLMCLDGKTVTVEKIDSVERIQDIWNVITFRLPKGLRNYVANRFFGHNSKPVTIPE